METRLRPNKIINVTLQSLKPFNCEETITILVCNQIHSHLKMKSPTKYSFTNHMYIHLDAGKQILNR